jgi:uncharacterized damage-inducible protein DinB
MITEQTYPLLMSYQGWERYQRKLVTMITPLTPEHLVLSAGHRSWSLGMVIQHMIADRVWWFQVWMGEGDPALAPIAHWDPNDAEGEHRPLTSHELISALESTWQMIKTALSSWTAADLTQIFSPPSVMSAEEQKAFGPWTRQEIIWHVLEHEITHGGELSQVLGGLGLDGVYGKR